MGFEGGISKNILCFHFYSADSGHEGHKSLTAGPGMGYECDNDLTVKVKWTLTHSWS
jgi:hypothetical protein